MLSYAEALEAIQALDHVLAEERIPLDQAQGRVLAEDIRLSGDQPPFDRATMDGFAVVLHGTRADFLVQGLVPAGSTFTGILQPGDAVRIMTGAPVPTGTTVIPLEGTDQAGKPPQGKGLTHKTMSASLRVTVTDTSLLMPGRNIARQGEDGVTGMPVIPAGTVLAPATIACAAMAGATSLLVRRAPRLAVITTGDEVGGTGAAAIRDSNGPYLAALTAALGLPTTRHHAQDDAVHLRATLVQAFEHADVIITTGGVSAGDKDFVPVLAPSMGLTTIFHHLAMQPGKPVFLARRSDGKLLVGLPGNPVSVLATAHLVLLPVLRRLVGLPAGGAWERRPLEIPWEHRGKRQLFLPARRSAQGVTPLRWNGSGDLIMAAAGDCLIDLAPGQSWVAGDEVGVLPYVGTFPGAVGLLPQRKTR